MSFTSHEPDRVARYFDQHAEDFDTIYGGRNSRLRRLRDKLSRGTVVQRLTFVDELASKLPPGRVIDVGCGSGRFSVRLAQHGWQVVGLDFAGEMIALAREHAAAAGVSDRCTFLEADFLDWDTEGDFDLGLAIGVFDYVANPLPLLARLGTMAGGRVVASFPKRWHALVPLRWARLRASSCPVHFYTRPRVEALTSAGRLRAKVISFHRDFLLVGEP